MNLLTHGGYMNRYFELLSDFSEHRDASRRAWQAVEAELCERFGVCRYRTHNSFQAARSHGTMVAKFSVASVKFVLAEGENLI